MRAARYHSPGVVTLDEIPRPVPGPGDLLIAVRAASICGTDRRIAANGHFKLGEGRALVLGHEFAGEVVDIGDEVVGYALGDRVSVTPNIGCGVCGYCRRGLNNMCPDYEAFGVTVDGGFADFVLIPAFAIARGNVFHVPDALSYQAASLVEPLSCCYSAIRQLEVSPGKTVLVMGAGPIGACHVMLAKLAGARVIISNSRQPRLDFAASVGADVLVNLGEQNLAEVVDRETDGKGVDVAITCVSKAAVQAEAVDLLATFGRVNFFAGLGQPELVPIDTNRVHYRALTLTGTTGSSNADYRSALDLAASGRIDLEPLATQTFNIAQIIDALAYAGSGQGMKAMIEFDAT